MLRLTRPSAPLPPRKVIPSKSYSTNTNEP